MFRFHPVSIFVLALAALTVPAPDRAQTLPSGDTVRDTVRLKEIVVTAYRMPVPRDRVTGTVTVIPHEELRREGYEYALEALRDVPGVTVVQTGGYGDATSLFLRGGESNYAKVLVDGVPVNDPGGDIDLGRLTTDNVQRIEIVRGPASVVYGSDAMTGVVQIFTRRGQGPPRWFGRAAGGSFGTLDLATGVRGGTDQVDYSFALSRFASDGHLAFNDSFRNTVGSARVGFHPDARTHGSLSLRYTNSDLHFPTDGAGNVVDHNARRPEDILTLSLKTAHDFTDRLQAEIQLGTNQIDRDFDDPPDGPADTLGAFAFQDRESIGRQDADARLHYRLPDRTVLTAGAAFENEAERSLNVSESQFGTSHGAMDRSRTNLGYYLQAIAEPVRGLALNAGARLDDNQRFGTFLTGRAGAAYRLPTGTRIRASVGNAFKEPTFFENFASGFYRGNPDLAPERTVSWEAGLSQSLLAGQLTLRGVYFHQDFRDLIQFTASSAPGEPNYFNVAAAVARGIEGETGLRLPAGLRLGGSVTWLHTEVTDAGFDTGPDASFVRGERLLRRPAVSFDLSASYASDRLGSVRLGLVHVGTRDDRDFSSFPARRVKLAPYTRVDLTLHAAALRGLGAAPVTPTLRIENLFDARYEQVAGFRERGRTVMAGLDVGLRL